MQIAQVVSGYSLGEADLLRRAMGKKKADEMGAQRERFVRGAHERGMPPKKVEKLFDLMAQFAEYGFNKSHSAAYGYLAYITGYLKAHYPVEFMSALLTSETGNTDKVVRYINECRDLGIKVLPPDVNASDLNFTPDGDAIRFGLGAVKNVGAGAVEAIVKARREGGSFKNLYDFCERVEMSGVNRRVIESMIKAGAMDSLEGTRSQKFAAIEECMEAGQRVWKDRASGQTGLFGGFLEGETAEPAKPLPNVPDWTQKEKLKGEKEMIGFYVTGHPLDEFRWKVTEAATHTSGSLENVEKGADVKLCGILTGIQRRRTKEGKPWASMQLEDWTGALEVIVFPGKFEELNAQLEEDRAVMIRGRAMPEDSGAVKVSAQELIPLDVLRVNLPTLISIRVKLGSNGSNAGERAEQLNELFSRKPGETAVRLRLEKSRDFSVTLDVAIKVRPDKEFQAEVQRICGTDSYEVLAS